MVQRKTPIKKSKQELDEEVKMLRSEVKRLRMLVEMLMDLVVEMNEDLDIEEELPGFLQPGNSFDVNSAM